MDQKEFTGGHKIFDTGEIDPATGFPILRHEPLSADEAKAIWEAAEKAQVDRAAQMPDEKAALRVLMDAHTRLRELGWREAIYCPKDGSHLQAIEAGSTGIHDCSYEGEWPKGSWWLYDGDIWPSRPILFKLYPDDQANEDARNAEARARYAAEQAHG